MSSQNHFEESAFCIWLPWSCLCYISSQAWVAYIISTVANGYVPRVRTASHFIFSWWHIPPSLSSSVASSFLVLFYNRATIGVKCSIFSFSFCTPSARLTSRSQTVTGPPAQEAGEQRTSRLGCSSGLHFSFLSYLSVRFQSWAVKRKKTNKKNTLLASSCFTCAGPAAVIKPSAALCRRGGLKLDHSEKSSCCFLYPQSHSTFHHDFCVIKWNICLETYLVKGGARSLSEDSHRTPSEQPLKPFNPNGWSDNSGPQILLTIRSSCVSRCSVWTLYHIGWCWIWFRPKQQII